ncbi:hypothetical protein HK103_002923, partial [Boothiomyces macroporosus]
QVMVENSIEYLASLAFHAQSNFQRLLNHSVVRGSMYGLEYFLKSSIDLDFNTTFIIAVKLNRLEMVKLLLKDPRVDPCCFNNRALEIACRTNIAMVQVLLDDKRTFSKFAVVCASYKGNLPIVQLLLQDDRFILTNRALRDAVTMGHTEIAKLLVEKGLDPSVDDNLNIQRAAQNGHYSLVEYLLRDPRVDPASKNNQAVGQAARRGYLDIVKLLLTDKRVKVNNRSIVEAAIGGHFETVEFLTIEFDIVAVDSALNDKLGIYCACVHRGKLDILDLVHPFLEKSPTIEEYPYKARLQSAFIKAARKGYTKVVKFLVQNAKVNPSIENNSAFMYAVKRGHDDIVAFLLEQSSVDPANVVNASFNRNEPIREAASSGYSRIVELLLSQQTVDPNVAPYGKAPPLALAVINGHVDVVKALLKNRKVDPAVNDSMAFREAAKKENIEILDLLLKDGRSKFNAKKNEAFISAIKVGNPQIIRLLLNEKTISPNAENNFAIKHCAQMGNLELVEMLLSDVRVDHTCDNNHALWRAELYGHTKVAELLNGFNKK